MQLSSVARHSPSAGTATGFLLVSLVPAVFWPAMTALLAEHHGFSASITLLLALGALIAVFLGLVFGALLLMSSNASGEMPDDAESTRGAH